MTRAAKASYKLIQCLAVVRGRQEVIDEDLRTLFRIVWDNIPSKRRAVLETVMGAEAGTTEVKESSGLSWNDNQAALEDLERFGAVECSKGSSNGKGRPPR